MAKESRRVKMTKMLLNESFLNHLSQKPMPRITVKEICEDADVNRSTYYLHFTDPYDQLRKLEAEIMVDMTMYVDSIMAEGMHDNKKQRQILRGILEYIQSKKFIFQVLLGDNGDPSFQRNILSFFGDRIFEKEPQDKLETVKMAYQYIYASMGSFGLIYYWIVDKEAVDIDTMTDWITGFNAAHKRL